MLYNLEENRYNYTERLHLLTVRSRSDAQKTLDTKSYGGSHKKIKQIFVFFHLKNSEPPNKVGSDRGKKVEIRQNFMDPSGPDRLRLHTAVQYTALWFSCILSF